MILLRSKWKEFGRADKKSVSSSGKMIGLSFSVGWMGKGERLFVGTDRCGDNVINVSVVLFNETDGCEISAEE